MKGPEVTDLKVLFMIKLESWDADECPEIVVSGYNAQNLPEAFQ